MASRPPPSPVDLEPEELLCLRLSLEVHGGPGTPLEPVEGPVDPARLEKGARSLVERGLLERPTFRPDRDLARRLLVVSEPDQRLVLMAVGAKRGRRILDVYARSGAYVAYERQGPRHRLGPIREAAQIAADLLERFTPRRTRGDFLSLCLDPFERAALAALVEDLTARTGALGLTPAAPPHSSDPTLGGILPLGREEGWPTLSPAAWKETLTRLEAKAVLRQEGGRLVLRAGVKDLTAGLARGDSHVLTRLAFTSEYSLPGEVTLVPVPGSLFALTAEAGGGLAVEELDAAGARRIVRRFVGLDDG